MIKKISVFCIWRDSEKTIHRTLKQLEDLESIDDFEFSYFFYENDSKDKTVEILEQWLVNRNGKLKSEKINSIKYGRTIDPNRMKLLCQCRNKCKNLSNLNDSDYSLLIDSDIIFNKNNLIDHINSINNLDNAVMITANVRQEIPDFTFKNSPDSYYDVYAFRDKHGSNGLFFSDCPSYKKDDQLNWKLGMPIVTMSSFGGFALIKSEIFNKVSWSSDIHCDHVNMCFDISRYGLIYINPRCKVTVNVGMNDVDLQICKNTGEKQLAMYNNYYL